MGEDVIRNGGSNLVGFGEPQNWFECRPEIADTPAVPPISSVLVASAREHHANALSPMRRSLPYPSKSVLVTKAGVFQRADAAMG